MISLASLAGGMSQVDDISKSVGGIGSMFSGGGSSDTSSASGSAGGNFAPFVYHDNRPNITLIVLGVIAAFLFFSSGKSIRKRKRR